ncbi:hypothetical protein [Cellulosilyticum sp. WCF-2]|uniref:hypothetical protein n=1 Tax=Cellulosilyticum sp. WCF-2 TaxID=2497860 RepID=UPI000F8C7AAA|nr:hypothetical protein [Cellulosilyticum sp. WCF-2]QEH68693.1 hypothetical protein EKH84_10010 [Cellulosilyticum sp. WCF-2]
MKKTEQMINEFLQMVEEDKVIAAQKLVEMEEQRHTLDKERSEISKALIREENKGDQDAVQKLNKELAKRVSEIGILDSKIEAYKEMGNEYESEAERVFEQAAKEYCEEYPKELEEENRKLSVARKELEDARALIRIKESAFDEASNRVSNTKSYMRYVLENRLSEITQYLPNKINRLEVPKTEGHYETIKVGESHYPGVTVKYSNRQDEIASAKTTVLSKTVHVIDREGYENNMEGKVSYYYNEILKGKMITTKRKSLADRILGR